MEELLISENQSVNISSKELVEQVRASVKVFSDAMTKSKAYYNLLASEAVEAFLREKGLLHSQFTSLHSSMKLLGDFELADIQLPNLSIDVRAVFDEKELFIPKKHFENKILPDVYLFVKMDEDLQNAVLLGFVKPASVNMQNQNDEYYFVNSSILSPVSELITYIQSVPVKDQYVLSENAEETLEKLIMLYMDNDIEPQKLEKLLDYLKNSVVAREKLIEFENFERLSSMAIQEFKDLDVKNNDFSRYIKTLVASDEFLQFGENDFSEVSEDPKTSGLFIDDEPVVAKDIEVSGQEVVEDVAETVVESAQDTENLTNMVDNENVLEQQEFESEKGFVEEVEEEISVEELPVIDEFEVFDSVDEFDMPETEKSVELFENSVVQEDVSEVLVKPLQEEDLELQVEGLDGIEQDLIQEETVTEEVNVDANVSEDVSIVEEKGDFENIEVEERIEILDEIQDEMLIEDEQVIVSDEVVQADVLENEETIEIIEEVESIELNDSEISPAVIEDVEANIEVASEVVDVDAVSENKEEFVLDQVLDIPMTEDVIEEFPEVISTENVEEVDMSGVVTDDISFTEESFDDIVDVVEAPITDANVDVAADDLTLEDLINTEEAVGEDIVPDALSESVIENAVSSVSDEEIDEAISRAGAGFIAEEDDEKPFVDANADVVDDSGDFSLDELLAMENDLSIFEDEQSVQNEQSAQTSTSEDVNVEGEFEESVVNSSVGEIFDAESDEQGVLSESDSSEEGSDFAFAVDNKPQSQKNILLPIAALVTVIGLAGAGAWYFLSNGKSNNQSFDIADNNTNFESASIDMNDIVPADSSLTTDIPVSDNINSKQEKTKAVTDAKTPEQPAKKEIKPLPEQLTMQKIKKDFSQPNTYLSVSKIVWDVPEYLTYNDDFAAYLQSLGSSVKLNLSSDLLLVTENTLFNKVKVKIQLKDSGRKFSAELTEGCGAKVVDDLVLQSVKNTLNLLQPPVNSLDTADEDLFVTIYL